MRFPLLHIGFLFLELTAFAQAHKNAGTQHPSRLKSEVQKNYTIKKIPLDSGIAKGRSALVLIIKPNIEAVRCRTRYTMNGDTIRPQLDSNGIYKCFVNPKKYKFTFFLSSLLNVITDSLTLGKNTVTYITVTFGDKDEIKFPTVLYGLDKPVIYIYPEKTTNVKILLDVKGEMCFSYPEYKNGWEFIANPSGDLEMGGKHYQYLFWEGTKDLSKAPVDYSSGFIVSADTLTQFLENMLARAGLNERESEDFITYWAPRMISHKKIYMHFLFNESCDYISKIQAEPSPQSVLRVYMLWGEVPSGKTITPQKIPDNKRKGYVLVDWGGSEISFPFSPY